MLCQSVYNLCLPRFLTSPLHYYLGFLPVLYTWFNKRRTAPVFLSSDSEQDDHPQTKSASPSQQLRGWKLLLLWFPAACDLTGTTVRNLFPIRPSPYQPSSFIASYEPRPMLIL